MAQIILANGTAPSTPASGTIAVYSKSSDKRLYTKDDAGVEVSVGGAASTSVSGVVMLATSAEVQAGTDNTKAVTPLSLHGGSLVSGTTTATTSGTSIDFTGIPSWVKRIMIMFNGVSTNGASNLLIQIGDSGGIETSGYLGASCILTNAGAVSVNNYTTGYGLFSANAANVIHGTFHVNLLDSTNNIWVLDGVAGLSNAATIIHSAGSKSTSSILDRIRLTTVNGTDTFDAGSVNIMYE